MKLIVYHIDICSTRTTIGFFSMTRFLKKFTRGIIARVHLDSFDFQNCLIAAAGWIKFHL